MTAIVQGRQHVIKNIGGMESSPTRQDMDRSFTGNNKIIAVIKGLNLKLILQDTVEIFVFCQRISNSTTVTQKLEIHQSMLSKTKKSYHYLGMSWIIYKN